MGKPLFTMKLHGAKDLVDQLEQLKLAVELKVLAQACRKAFKPVLAAAVAAAPFRTGLTRSNIKIQVQKPKSGDSVVVVGLRVAKVPGMWRTGPRGGKRDESPHWRWHFIEIGAPAHGIKPNPIFRRALDTNAEQVLATLKTELQKGIDRALRKGANRRGLFG